MRPTRRTTAAGRHGRAEHHIGIEQWQPQRQRVRNAGHELAPAQPGGARDDLAEIGRHVRVEQVGLVQLCQKTDEVLLRERVVTQPLAGKLPDRIHRAFAIHEADDEISGGREAMKVP